jgi:signal transduction histidine kinase
VQQIARSHGGEVSVHSADGRTTFRVWLPRTAAGFRSDGCQRRGQAAI